MYEAMNTVSTYIQWPGKVIKQRKSEKRSRSEGQAQALYQLLEDIDIEGKMPQFLAGLTDMEVVQRALTNTALSTGDDVQIGAQLESLVKGQHDLIDLRWVLSHK